MLSSTCITAQAQVYTTAEAQARAEISTRKAETCASIYAQLEEQDALNHLSIYLDPLYPEIEAEVYAKYGYAKTISVYSIRDGQSSSAVSGWDAHPTVSYSSRLLNVVQNEAK